MRLICFWCAVIAVAFAQDDSFYGPQTFRQHGSDQALFKPSRKSWEAQAGVSNRIEPYHQRSFFTPTGSNDVVPQSTIAESWRPGSGGQDQWRNSGSASPIPRDPWRSTYITKEQQAAILHHKQALTSEGSFRFEYASDNGVAAGEVIQPDGSRIGGYQYKDPSGQLVKLKYRAGKDGFQILEGSHIPKSPEPVAPHNTDNYYQQAYQQQQQQYQLQQQYNQQRPQPQPQPQQNWNQNQGYDGQRAAGGQYFVQSLRPGQDDDGQYRENDVEQNRGPHSFGDGYAFSFQG